ncbi:hypothetical protein J6590_055697 [Homalodisca vitripennis]|nr:hypothetical protein J6590_055697 [Homalodisca vitripennis]
MGQLRRRPSRHARGLTGIDLSVARIGRYQLWGENSPAAAVVMWRNRPSPHNIAVEYLSRTFTWQIRALIVLSIPPPPRRGALGDPFIRPKYYFVV